MDCPDGDNGTRRGCTYTVPALVQHPPWPSSNMSYLDDLYIGASDAVRSNYIGAKANTIAEFYLIYKEKPNAISDKSENGKRKILRANLDLCLYTYNTTMTFGITETTQIEKITNLNWVKGRETIGPDSSGATSYADAVAVAAPGTEERFWTPDIAALRRYLSLIFSGSSDLMIGRYTSDAAYAFSKSIYGDALQSQSLGVWGPAALLENLAISMTNAYAYLPLVS